MEKAMAPHSGALAWKILWTEKPAGLQSTGSDTTAETRRQQQQQSWYVRFLFAGLFAYIHGEKHGLSWNRGADFTVWLLLASLIIDVEF